MRNLRLFEKYFLRTIVCSFFFISTLGTLVAAEEWLEELGPEPYGIRFGLLVDNDQYQIYRSSLLGDGGLEKLEKHLFKHKLPFPKTIIYMNYAGYKFPFYFAVEEYELQEQYGYQFYHSFGNLKTYLDGHDPYNPRDDIDDMDLLGRKASRLFEEKSDGLDGDVDDFFRILELVLDPENQPVLFHCFGGRHRTGMIAMAIRYLQGGYWVNGPRKEKHDLWLNPAQYEYHEFNHTFFREENIRFIERVSQDIRFIRLKHKYSDALQDGVLDIRKDDL